MKIGIDCRTINDPSGVGTYTRELVRNLLKIDKHNEYVLFFFAEFSEVAEFERPNVVIKYFPPIRHKKYLPIIYSHFLISQTIRKEKLGACLFPANIIPLGYFGKSVVTIHDLAVYKLPELFPDKIINFDRKIVVPASLRKAAKIVAVSNSTKNDIIGLFKIKDEKIVMIYEGAPSVKVLSQTKINRPYFLFLGTIEPRKNIERLIKSFTNFVQADRWRGELVLAGRNGWKNNEVFELIKKSNKAMGRGAIKYLDYVAETDKPKLYGESLAFVFPSLYEGFGLPVLEAMSYGVPVITSNNSSLPEVAGGAAILVDPLNVKQITEALRRLATDVKFRQSMIEKGRKKSQEFTWEAAARQTLKVLREI